MSYSCSICNFKTNFSSALKMHNQLHHENSSSTADPPKPSKKFNTSARETQNEQIFPIKPRKSLRSLARSSSATRLLDKIRLRLSKSRLLFSHPEETTEEQNIENLQYKSPSKISAAKPDDVLKEIIPRNENVNESFGCHLCSLVADRITVLDRHLLNDHKLGMENLLKPVMNKTKDGLADDNPKSEREKQKSYYIPTDEFVMENGVNNIKIYKHAATNTDLKWTDIPDLVGLCSDGTEDIFDVPTNDNKEVFEKMRTLNEYMSRFLSASKTLNKVLSKELSHKDITRSNERSSRLGLGESTNTSRSTRGIATITRLVLRVFMGVNLLPSGDPTTPFLVQYIKLYWRLTTKNVQPRAETTVLQRRFWKRSAEI